MIGLIVRKHVMEELRVEGGRAMEMIVSVRRVKIANARLSVVQVTIRNRVIILLCFVYHALAWLTKTCGAHPYCVLDKAVL